MRPLDRVVLGIGGVAVALLCAVGTAGGHGAAARHATAAATKLPAPTLTGTGPTYPGGRVRTYYVKADRTLWDYAPHRRNMITGKPFTPEQRVYVQRGPGRIGSRYWKSIYHQYTDRSFRHRVARPAQWRSNGFLGPVIQAEVGDTIIVHFKNATPFPTGMHPHGVFYAKDSEGAPYNDGTRGADKADDAVPPGHTHTYVWHVPDRSGPGPGDPSSVMWMYHGHTDEVADTYAGLVGPLIITRRGMANPDGSPKDVDDQEIALFEVDNENQSPYLERNVRDFAEPPRPHPGDEEFEESNLMHSINGYVYGNGRPFTMHEGDVVRWYVMSMGTEVDLHTPHWHGNVLTTSMGNRTDVVQLLPGSMMQGDMDPDDRGTWLFHCHVNDHIVAGMLARYRVL